MGKQVKLIDSLEVEKQFKELNLKTSVGFEKLANSINKIVEKLPKNPATPSEEIQSSVKNLAGDVKRFHGAKISPAWFPPHLVSSPCVDKFGYMTKPATRNNNLNPTDPIVKDLIERLGDMMGDVMTNGSPNTLRDSGADSTIPAGYTYFGQFVDHDITFDISSSLTTPTDANTINNMRTPALDLDSVYGRGPALDPFLYAFPSGVTPPTAIKMQLGRNQNVGAGGPTTNGLNTGMITPTNFDVPRVQGTNTAVIGDPRNNENLIVSQFHHVMLKFHNAVVDRLIVAFNAGNLPLNTDIFVEAKKIVTQHYQWAVVNDFLKTICGQNVNPLFPNVTVGSSFRMPVEFSVAAYRFGHSMIRNSYFVNHNFQNATLGQVFQFINNPMLPVFSNWVINFDTYFQTGNTVTQAPPLPAVPAFNNARKIDSVLANGLESLPGATGMMAILAKRNLLRGLMLGVPSGQAVAVEFGITPLTAAQLTTGLPTNEITLLNEQNQLLLKKTPLWYYVLREAAVLKSGNSLGPVGTKILADTFGRILKRNANSYLNVSGGFTPSLPQINGSIGTDFTLADLVVFAGVTQP